MIFGAAQSLITLVLGVGFAVVKVWAFVDVLRRPQNGFPAVGRLNKTFWLIILGISAVTGVGFWFINPIGLIGIAGLIAALVYLFDVRPRLIEITGGGSRW
jgi:hypothetical protein